MERPIQTPLPADLPVNWQTNQIVSPDGVSVGLDKQHGYNYQAGQINAAQRGVNALNEAFDRAAALDHRHTAAEVGALPSSGGTVTGDIELSGHSLNGVNCIMSTRQGVAIDIEGIAVHDGGALVPNPYLPMHAANKKYVDAALSTKANWNGGVLSGGANVLEWALTQEINTCCSCDNTVTGVPISGYWMMQLRIYPGAGWRILEAQNVLTGCSYSNTYNVRAWDGWIGPLATATPPQEYALPLAAGYRPSNYVTYCKSQFGRVYFDIGGIRRTDNTLFQSFVVFCTLPPGYRPKREIVRSVDFLDAVGGPAGTGHIHICTNGEIYVTTSNSNTYGVMGEYEFWAAAYGPNALQSQVRMPMARMALAAVPEEPVDKCMCVVDADGSYVEFVMVTVTQDELGALYTVHYYELQEGEWLVDSPAPPTKRPHVGADGFIRPRWDDDTAVWVEGATEEETTAWEAEHPAPELAGPSAQEDADAMIVDHEYRLTLLELGVN